MEKYILRGGVPLIGDVEVSGMKNAALPILYATILVGGKCTLEHIPNISDVLVTLEILKGMGAEIRMINRTTYEIDTTNVRGGSSIISLFVLYAVHIISLVVRWGDSAVHMLVFWWLRLRLTAD